MRTNTALKIIAIATLVMLSTLGCRGRTPSPPPMDPDPNARNEYTIGVTDVLLVSVYRNPELTVEVPVRMDGMISVPLIDDVQAEGATPMELKRTISTGLSAYITSPDVTIIVREMNSRFVSVIGEVDRENRIALTQNLRVLEAIALAGGFTIFADKSDVRVVRWQPDGTEIEYRFDYNAYKRGRAPGSNFVLQPGDTIIVSD
jgi:polysaccharide export outer membrane protein